MTTCEAVNTVDPNHFTFWDRFNGNKGIPDRVLDTMKDHVCTVYAVFCEPSKKSRMFMRRLV
jgi:hypothetical protein